MNIVKTNPRYQKNFITKSNSLVEGRYKLSLQESRVILWLLNQIQPEDEDFKRYHLDIKKFAEITSLSVDNQYNQLKQITKNLTKRSLEIYESDQKTLLHVSWLSAAFYELTKGYVVLEFSPYLKPYLLKIKSHFTTLQTTDLLKLRSIYSIRIFELLKQYEAIGKRTIELSELRLYCGVKPHQYSQYNAIKLYIIERATNEINSKTEYEIDYSEIKESRKVVAIEWTIKKKNLEKEKRTRRIQNLEKELRSQSILIESMVEYGYSKMMAKRLIKEHGEEVVTQAIKAIDIQVERGQAKNPKAMLHTVIIEKWKPDVYTAKKK